MVKLFPISDTHANFMDTFRHANASLFNPETMKSAFEPLGTGADTVLLACGDIGERLQGVIWCERMLHVFPDLEICYCPGNHEFYNTNMELLQYDLKVFSNTNPKLHILDGVYEYTTVIKDSNGTPILTVVGGTLWTDYNKESASIMNLAQRDMNDYRYIKSNNNVITADEILKIHYETKKNIFREIEEADKNIPLVCMTHHTPYIGVPTDGLYYCYHVDMTEEFNKLSRLPIYWFSGHTHKSEIKKITFPAGEATFISNQVGYPHELYTGFTADCILEV